MLDLVLPAPCAGCGAEVGGQLCPACRELLVGLRGRRAGPSPAPAGLPPVHSCAVYGDPVRRLLLAHKERGALRLAGPLGAVLAAAVGSALDAVGPAIAARDSAPLDAALLDSAPLDAAALDRAPHRAALPGEILLVPVPSARAAVRARGHDPMLRLARCAARELNRSGRPCRVGPALRPSRRVADQAGLGAAARHRNLHGALSVPARFHSRLAGRQIIVVDDLVTTGASLTEAARALATAGAPPLAAATIAATVRRAGGVPNAVHRRRQPG
ncbi:ComF family protein [Kitasatospora mediocidica]|uniref:ComF family protein n=1 Tax=Kitasatospora mediocidica TaxID=58352 RepID=UPI001E47D995|nr:phosphoribosyltransferase family protein [Kitasatospora mediocidica]